MYFNPHRWNEPTKPGTYQVFGAGNRLCPGNMLARIQLALLLHHLSIGYKWELINPNADITYLPHPTPIDGVEVKFSKL
ncbi:ent-kaurenoic acid monooxygenase [Trifolium repens]|nr:ent-kaurenoic acid monooxygenase [Trifolium repens]